MNVGLLMVQTYVWISEAIQNPNYLRTDLIHTIRILDTSNFRMPSVYALKLIQWETDISKTI